MDVLRTGYTRVNGYVQTYVRRECHLAHRLVWEECFGPIPEGLCVCHHCDNPPCVNPEHLFLGTQADNMRDMITKGRRARQTGENAPGRKLTAEQVEEIRKAIGTTRAIASRFGISQSQVSKIRRREQWQD
jgi:hypothetical protein